MGSADFSSAVCVSGSLELLCDPSGAGGCSFYQKTSYSLINKHRESFNHLVSFQVSFFIQCHNIFIVEIFVS